MGKKQHSKDRMYLTTTEWRHEWGGFKDKTRVPFKRLPFHCCAIAFTPFEDAVCTEDGTVFDVINIVPFVLKHKKHPVTGAPLQLKDLIKLNWHKNGEGQYACPVTGKVFTEHTHIAAIKTTGNVYAYEAIDELCVKPKNWKDLITEEPFARKDIIHIQDPLNLSGRTTEQFDHVLHGLTAEVREEEGPLSNLRNMSEDMKRALGALQTPESKAAFEGGGGGKTAEAMRLIAAAKAAAHRGTGVGKQPSAIASAAGGTTTTTTSATAPQAAGDSAAKEGAGDWRLKAPEKQVEGPRFRPGAATWDTEDYTTAAGKALKRKEDRLAAMVAEAEGRAVTQPEPKGTKGASPQERYEAAGHVKYIESFSSTGRMSQSLTSTYAAVDTRATRQLTRKHRNPTKKGYARIHTTLGDLNVELHCDMVPRTCENWLALADMKYYDNTVFHRSIKNFMIQGGDPTGTGTGGESIYGKTFANEIDQRLRHEGRGVLSMANSGKDTNGSQFFITYKSCKHLDYKHSVFGRVVGGWEVLGAMEKLPTDANDRPTQEVKLTGVTVFTNPFQEMEDAEQAAETAARKEEAKSDELRNRTGDYKMGKWFSAPSTGGEQQQGLSSTTEEDPAGSTTGSVGKYLKLPGKISAPVSAASTSQVSESGKASADEAKSAMEAGLMAPPPAKKPKQAAGYGNFDAW